MPEYLYAAFGPTGARTTGSVTANSEREVAGILDSRGLMPVEIKIGKGVSASDLRNKKVPPRVMATFFGQLSDLLHSGVPLLRSLELLKGQTNHINLRAMLEEIRNKVADGQPLSEAIAQYPKAFNELAVSMVRAGQEGGFLEDVLKRVATFTDHQEDLKGRVIGAMIYPVVLSVIGFIVVTLLMLFIVPEFKPIFKDLIKKNKLPPLTALLLGFSDFMKVYWWVVLIGMVGGFFGLRAWAKSQSGSQFLDRIKIQLPLFGSIYLGLSLSRFMRILGTMLHNGIPILKALQIAKDSTGNRILSDAIADAAESVTAGQKLADPFRRIKYIPRDIAEIIAIGEESNNLEKVLIDVADSTERRTSRKMDILVKLVEPLMLMVMAGFVLVVVVGLLQPVFQMGQTFRN